MARGPVDYENLIWPADDRHAREAILRTFRDVDRAIKHVRDFTACIQAGGNVGVWPLYLSERFESVYTFEPDPINFSCMALNAAHPGIVMFNAAVGDEHKLVRTELPKWESRNCGALVVREGGVIPTLRIDDLALTSCGLICLDVEGSEFQAIKGALNTIRAFHPVLMFEDKGLGVKQGFLSDFLAGHDYRQVDSVNNDRIFA